MSIDTAPSTPEAARRPVGRPRSSQATSAILEATLTLLAVRGYAGMGTAEVAAAARASKATLYRRWPTKAALVADALRYGIRRANPVIPRTGDVRADLITVMDNLIRALAFSPLGGAVRAVVSEAAHEPALSHALTEVELEARRRGPLRPLLIEAKRQGLIPAAADLDLRLDTLLAVPYFQLLVRQSPPNPGLSTHLVDQALSG